MTESADTVVSETSVASLEEIQQGWHELNLRVAQLEVEKEGLDQENKALRFLIERIVEHRQQSHGELVLLLTSLVSKLPINDIGVVVSRLVEHNAHVNEACAALAGGKAEAALPQPVILKALEQTKRELAAALKPLVEEFIKLETPLDSNMLRKLIEEPESFYSSTVLRANRCYLKGQVPRERIVSEFGEQALVFFNDMTTDPKRNPRPKPEEIVLAFKDDFEAWFEQNPKLLPDKRKDLHALYQRLQKSKSATEEARAQKNVFLKISFILDLLHYYENQGTEAPDITFAQRLPALVEQLVITGAQTELEEKAILEVEGLLAFILSQDHRMMVINNIGKSGGAGRTLKYVLRLRAEKSAHENPSVLNEVIPDFVRHMLPVSLEKPPEAKSFTAILKHISPELQKPFVKVLMGSDRIRKEDAEKLGKSIAEELGLTGLEEEIKAAAAVPEDTERQVAWHKINDMIASRVDPATVAAAIRDRLHTKYDAEEVKQSWVILTEADPISLIRIFCQLPYLADGKTDPIARVVMETYVQRLTHEKYSIFYNKVSNSLRNMFKANPGSPTLLNFVNLVKWLDPEVAKKLSVDIGMAVPAQ